MLIVDTATKAFGTHPALNQVSFQVPRGRVVGFLGPNGAGKTTTMRAALSLLDLDSGSITWEGRLITSDLRRRFGYMPEERGLYPRMRLGAHLEFLARLSATPPGVSASDLQAHMLGLVDRVGLSGHLATRIDQLSFGNRQRVQLVAALAHSPDLLILDEPFSGLDPMAAKDLVALIRREAARGAAVLFSSHQMDLVSDVCDDVVLISAGEIRLRSTLQAWELSAPVRRLHVVFSGPPTDVHLPSELRVLPSKPHTLTAEAPASLSATRAAELVAEAATRAGVEVLSFNFSPPPLTDLFSAVVSPVSSNEAAS